MGFDVPRSGAWQLPSKSRADCRILETPGESFERVWVCRYRILGQKNNQIRGRKHADPELTRAAMIKLPAVYGMNSCARASECLYGAVIRARVDHQHRFRFQYLRCDRSREKLCMCPGVKGRNTECGFHGTDRKAVKAFATGNMRLLKTTG